jgi:hypothetical protein
MSLASSIKFLYYTVSTAHPEEPKNLPIDVKILTRLGINEISLANSQGKFIVVLVDLNTHKLIGLVAKRKRSGIEKVMR